MYEAFYGLRERPFNLTPDPKFLYLSEKHKEAFAHLLFGIKNRSGFVMVTGEIGTGKTTISRNLLNQFDAETDIAFVFNPSLNPIELLKKICTEFGIAGDGGNVLELTEAINDYLLEAAGKGKNCVLIIDEAQNLSPQVLEQIRLLSNLETETEKLIQIILIGQPELTEKLTLNELRQLDQRITARYHLKPLNENETLEYIAYRLHVAGGRRNVKFAKSAVRAVYKASRGTPRVINAICDRALLIGYTKEVHTITAVIVWRAAHEVRGDDELRKRRRRKRLRGWIPSPSLVIAAVLVFVLIRFVAMPMEKLAREAGVFNRLISSEDERPAGGDEGAENTVSAVSEDLTPIAREAGDVIVDSPVARKILKRLAPRAGGAGDAVAFAEGLAAIGPDASREAAASALLRAWNMALVSGGPADDSLESLEAFARDNGFACEYLSPALAQLLAINLPGLVRFRVGEESFWAALVRERGGMVEISYDAGEPRQISRREFQNYYAGEAFILWRDPNPRTPDLLSGRRGGHVTRLKQELRQLGRIAPNNVSDLYDPRTGAAVAKIQAETGLLVDAISGKQVRMVVTSWTGGADVPSLRPRLNAAALAEAPVPAPQVAGGPVEAADVEETVPLPAALSSTLPPGPGTDEHMAAVSDTLMEVRELPAANGPAHLPPVDTEAMKESTPPAVGSVPLVPRGSGN